MRFSLLLLGRLSLLDTTPRRERRTSAFLQLIWLQLIWSQRG
jgi:hypothetical protein